MVFSDYRDIMITFFKRDEKDFFINCLGFNNFNYIEPIKYFRTQSCYTLHIVIEGSGTLKVDNKTYNVRAGDMFFIPPNVHLCYYPDEDNLWKYVWVELYGENSSLYGNKLGFTKNNHVIRCCDFKNVYLLLQGILTKQVNNIPVGYYDVVSVFFKILDINIRETITEQSKIAESVVSYINCHYNKTSLKVSELCSYFNISHSYMCRIFKKANNCTIKNYITNLRVNEACKLLKDTSLRVNEIAYSVGFSDDIHFMKMFKKTRGLSPSQYRQAVLDKTENINRSSN